jgi:hypothetical protein
MGLALFIHAISRLEATAKNFLSTYKSSRTFKEDFDSYIDRVENDEKLSKPLKYDASSIREYVNEKKTISGIED